MLFIVIIKKRPCYTDGELVVKLTKKLNVTPCVSGKIFLGPPRLYQELEELQHDLAVVEEVSLLVGTLNGIYQVTKLLHRRRFPKEKALTACFIFISIT